jgi:DNA-binding NtrC family response regulator
MGCSCPRPVVDASAPRVLVVEADRDLRHAMMAILSGAGYLPDGVDSGLDAVAFFRGGGSAAIVIVDADNAHVPLPGEESAWMDRMFSGISRAAPTIVCSAHPRIRHLARRRGARATALRGAAVLARLPRLIAARLRAGSLLARPIPGTGH